MFQLSWEEGIENQLKNIPDGDTLEDVVNAVFASLGYFVIPNVKVIEGGQNVCEIDTFASLQTPFFENRIIVECKNGVPQFEEISKFHSVRHILSPSPNELFLISRANVKDNRKEVARKLDVKIIEKNNLINWILPLLGFSSEDVKKEKIRLINKWIIVFYIQRYYTNLDLPKPDHKDLFQYRRILSEELWSISDPLDQLHYSFEIAKDLFPNVSQKTANTLGVNLRSSVRNADNDFIECSMFVELHHRAINLYTVTRTALYLQKEGREKLLEDAGIGRSLRNAINKIATNPRLLFGFPNFFQYWIYIWGGVLHKSTKAEEYEQMAKDCCTTVESIRTYLRFIELTYSSTDFSSLFYDAPDKIFFKYVPASFRALGHLTCESFEILKSDGKYFGNMEDSKNKNALKRVLDIDDFSGLLI